MLNFMQQLTYQAPDGFTWTCFGDDQDLNIFYIVPQPQLVQTPAGQVELSIQKLATGDPKTNGMGSVTLAVELSVPQEIITAFSTLVQHRFPGATSPIYQALDTNPDVVALLTASLTGTTTTFSATASHYGGNVATFVLQLSAHQLASLVSALSATGSSGLSVMYNMTVPASLQSVDAVLGFNSQIAYQYQVTQPTFNSWGDETSPGSVTELMQQSASSTTDITWGIADPPANLQQAVMDWANNTLADLVSAEVAQAIALEGESSGTSFNISSVASFTNTYIQNQVVNWYIHPQAILPGLGAALQSYVKVVNEQQQQMTVSVQLPFATDVEQNAGRSGPVAYGTTNAIQVKTLVATLTYPGLPETQGTLTFSASGSQTVTTPFDTTAGPAWKVDYTVTYADGQSFTSSFNVTGAVQTIAMPDAGILTVTFDAQAAYNASPAPSNVGVNLTFGSGESAVTNLSIPKAPATGQLTVTTLQQPPLGAYNYTPVFTFGTAEPLAGSTVAGATGSYQALQPITGTNLLQVILYVPPDSSVNPVFNSDVKLWYMGTLPGDVPGLPKTTPTQQNPQTWNPTLGASGFTSPPLDFATYIVGNVPLSYSASITTAGAGDIEIGPQLVSNEQASILISPTQRYFTLQLTPAAIDWATAGYSQVQVIVTPTSVRGAKANGLNVPQTFTWTGPNELDSRYLTIPYELKNPNHPAPTVTYSYQITYITVGSPPVAAATQTATSPVLDIPVKQVTELVHSPRLAAVEA